MFKPIFYKLGAEIKLLRTIPRHNWSYLRLPETRSSGCVSHLSGDGGDEGWWAGRGDEGEGVSGRAGRISRRVEGETHGDAAGKHHMEGVE